MMTFVTINLEFTTMKFAEDHNEARYKITGYEATGISINNKLFEHSMVLSPMEFVQNWEPQTYSSLTADHLDEFYQLDAEIILIGTGEKQIFPNPDVLRRLAKEHIGFEVMTTQAACRTFNILMSEGRNVVAGLFIR